MTPPADRASARASTRLSWLLRHGAREAGLTMDEAGWARIDDVLHLGRLDRTELDAIVAANNKQRYQIDGERVRAVQGHSLEGTPVTLDALEASWKRVDGDAPVFHGTGLAVLAAIARDGIIAGARTHVHLAPERASVVGKRAQVEVLLEVSAIALREAGIGLFRAPNGVLLARHVPSACVVDVHACTPRASVDLDTARTLFRSPTSEGALGSAGLGGVE